MNEEITVDSFIEEVYTGAMKKLNEVLRIFNDFFGEEKVDMQGYLNLSRFKSYMDCTPISEYTRYGQDGKTITELNQEQLAELYTHKDAIVDDIKHAKFRTSFILVHFPHVRVTNEHDRYVDINHLWAKIRVDCDGSMISGFSLNRSDYTLDHFRSNYLHSHISSIPTSDFTVFKDPCLGTGPIRDTITSLSRAFDEDIWNLFCLELSKYVTVESISGRPYNYLEHIGANTREVGECKFKTYTECPYFGDFSRNDIMDFTKYLVESKSLKFNYVNGSYSIGMSFIDYMVLVSNKFIEWYNKEFNKGIVTLNYNTLKSLNVIKEGILSNGKIYYENNRRTTDRYTDYIGKKVCTFKGVDITITISDITKIEDENKSVFLHTQLALYILNTILKVLNYRYGREKAITKEGGIGTEIRYI